MQLNAQLLKLYPRVAILDDDIELISDIKSCIDSQVIVDGFSSFEVMVDKISTRYQFFMENLLDFFRLMKDKNGDLGLAKNIFQKLRENKPYSVVLVDLNLGHGDQFEGFKLCEVLEKYFIKPVVYTGNEAEIIAMDMINQGIIAGYLNKSCDFFEMLIPTITNINNDYYNRHYNLTHLASLEGISYASILSNIRKLTLCKELDEFIVLDSKIETFFVKNQQIKLLK